ncbi:MAG: NAD-glutamate dehydrogenase, partial [Actinomycetota bacterium]|nr:NAD-glutamate dehydrogenase [Actinomycetota bacterium]
RRDEFGRFVSALVFLPRDRYNTTVRLRIEALLREAFGAETVDHAMRVGESPLAQLHFIVRVAKGRSLPDVTEQELQPQLDIAIRGWEETFVEVLHAGYGEDEAATLLSRYGNAFPEAYKENVTPAEAVKDVALLERLEAGDEFAVHLYDPEQSQPGKRYLTLVSPAEYPLTRVLPVLTDLGVDVVDERPYRVTLGDGRTLHISDFGLTAHEASPWGDATWGEAFEDVFSAVWTGAAESDRLNSLVLLGGLDWRRIVILRAIAMYVRQIGSAFSVEYIEQALIENSRLAADLVRLFEIRFDPG